jgi:hypothetical protein
MKGMRLVMIILAMGFFLSSKAQAPMPVGSANFMLWQPFPAFNRLDDSTHLNQKWYFTKYASVNAGFGFYNGGSSTYISVPVGVQLNHPLNNNLIAFAGISAAPVFFSFNNAFMNPAFNKSYPGPYMVNPYSFGMNSRVEMGLMYINDAKTFSISGSIGIERGYYPVYPVYPAERAPVKKH